MTADRKDQGLESSRHLFQPPVYRADGGPWARSYADALGRTTGPLSWDVAAILSGLGQSFAVGDSTLLREIRRRPWLADDNGHRPIPPHDRLAPTPQDAARRLYERLREEALEVCADRETIYLLLSGGLDSRIIAGVLAGLVREGKITRPTAVTWGMPNSRDVAYGRAAAEHLGFPWRHVDLEPEQLVKNVEAAGTLLGGLVSPAHLHGMLWFADAPPGALVIASSWGDSVGRAEFSARHVLELKPIEPNDAFGLLRPEILAEAAEGMREELAVLRARSGDVPTYVRCEHEQQGHYMRGMIGHAMSVINYRCHLYQMFTHPRVYELMWSFHPSLRTDAVYAQLLERVDEGLARMPWARNNRALRGPTRGARRDLVVNYHDYSAWTAGLYDRLKDGMDPAWFGATGIFDEAAVVRLAEAVRTGVFRLHGSGRNPYDIWLWLAGFRRFADWVEAAGHTIELTPTGAQEARQEAPVHPASAAGKLRHKVRQNYRLTMMVRKLRRSALRREALRRWPVRAESDGGTPPPKAGERS